MNVEDPISRDTITEFLEFAYDLSEREPELITLKEYLED